MGGARFRRTRRRPPAARTRGLGQRLGVCDWGWAGACCWPAGGALWSGSGVVCTGCGAGMLPSSTDVGRPPRADRMASTNASNRKIPADQRVTWVRMVTAWRPPIRTSVPAPPPSDARPPPCPAWSRTEVTRTQQVRSRMTMSTPYMARGYYSGGRGPHKLGPGHGVERRAAHQHAIQLPLGEQVPDVPEIDAAPVQHRHLRRTPVAQPASHLPVDRRRIGGCGVLPRPDRPDRLVGDHDVVQVIGPQAFEPRRELTHDDAERLAGFPLRQGLAHAEHRDQVGVERRADLATRLLVGLAEHVAPLRMPD